MRKKQAKKRPLLPDPKFNDQLVTRFVNMLMWDGKKSVSFKILRISVSVNFLNSESLINEFKTLVNFCEIL